jgi:hypothetical protein
VKGNPSDGRSEKMTKRKLILEREGAVMLRMSIRNFHRWAIQWNILPLDISAPGAKKRSLRYYEDEIREVIEKATKERNQLASVLRFERK